MPEQLQGSARRKRYVRVTADFDKEGTARPLVVVFGGRRYGIDKVPDVYPRAPQGGRGRDAVHLPHPGSGDLPLPGGRRQIVRRGKRE